MVQTKQGAANNEWLAFVCTCSEQYRELKRKQSATAATEQEEGQAKGASAKKATKNQRARPPDVPVKR